MFTPTRAVQQRVSERRASEGAGLFKLLTVHTTTRALKPHTLKHSFSRSGGSDSRSAQTFYHEIFLCAPSLLSLYTNWANFRGRRIKTTFR
jgi:hypothetical protein